MIRKSKLVYALIVVMILSLTLLGCSKPAATPAPTEKPVEKPYFEGKTIKIIVPNSPGGGHDTGARMLATYIEKYSGAKNVIVENHKGAGGLVGMNEIWNTKDDGSTIMFASAVTHLLTYIAGDENVQFDPLQTTWLARAIQKPRILHVGKETGVANIAELQKLTRPFNYPAVGLDDDFYTMAVVADALGLKLRVVTGFGGDPECMVAELQGSVDGLFTTFQAADDIVKGGDVVPMVVLSATRQPEYKDIPTVLEVATAEGKDAMQGIVTISEMYESFWGPPNMDPKAKAAWDDIMKKVFTDPEVKEKIVKIGGTYAFKTGDQLKADVASSLKASAAMKPIFEAAAASVK